MSLVIDKALNLLNLVAAGNDTLNSLVRESGLSRSTTHRLLSSLVEHGYLSYDAKRYDLGYRLLELGEQKKRSLKFLDSLQPTLRRYADLTKDTIHVAILANTDIVLVERIAGQRELQIRSFVGQRAPAFMTAVGKSLIGRQPPDTWSNYLRNIPKGYPKRAADIRADFETARKRNFATDIDECSVGTCGIASTFRLSDDLYAAVSINGATVYFPSDRMNELKKLVTQLARELESILLQNSKAA